MAYGFVFFGKTFDGGRYLGWRNISAPDQIFADYQGQTATSNLHILAVGIDRYQNSSYNLNYATADASALVEEVQSKAGDIFGEVKVTYIRDKKVTVKKLEAFLNDAVPELTEQYKGMVQYPRSWSRGQDFPIGVVNE